MPRWHAESVCLPRAACCTWRPPVRPHASIQVDVIHRAPALAAACMCTPVQNWPLSLNAHQVRRVVYMYAHLC